MRPHSCGLLAVTLLGPCECSPPPWRGPTCLSRIGSDIPSLPWETCPALSPRRPSSQSPLETGLETVEPRPPSSLPAARSPYTSPGIPLSRASSDFTAPDCAWQARRTRELVWPRSSPQSLRLGRPFRNIPSGGMAPRCSLSIGSWGRGRVSPVGLAPRSPGQLDDPSL